MNTSSRISTGMSSSPSVWLISAFFMSSCSAPLRSHVTASCLSRKNGQRCKMSGGNLFLFYNETTFAQFQNIRRRVRGTGNVLSALLHKSATVNLTVKSQASKLQGCIDTSKPQTLTVKLHIHNLSMIKLRLLQFIH